MLLRPLLCILSPAPGDSKYYQSTSKALANALQNPVVPCGQMEWKMEQKSMRRKRLDMEENETEWHGHGVQWNPLR